VTKIVVACKYVPDSTGDRSFKADGTVDRDSVDGLLSELDEYAVEQALQIAEAQGGGITAVTVGTADAVQALRKAIQMGVGDAVHVQDDAIAGSDVFATSAVLAAAIGKLDADIVLFGMASTDGGGGVVPTLVADRLGLPALTHASSVTVDGSTVRISRDSDTAVQRIEARIPVVVSVTDRTDEARYPSFKGILAAKKKKVTVWSLDDLVLSADQVGLDHASTRVVVADRRPARTAGQIVTDDGDGGIKLVEYLTTTRSSERPFMSEVLVLVATGEGGKVAKSGLELLTLARRLGEPSAVVFGDADNDTLGRYGVGTVYRFEGAEYTDYLVAPKAEAIAALVARGGPPRCWSAPPMRARRSPPELRCARGRVSSTTRSTSPRRSRARTGCSPFSPETTPSPRVSPRARW
jgi:electron transfer flavoprotein beta subunit